MLFSRFEEFQQFVLIVFFQGLAKLRQHFLKLVKRLQDVQPIVRQDLSPEFSIRRGDARRILPTAGSQAYVRQRRGTRQGGSDKMRHVADGGHGPIVILWRSAQDGGPKAFPE